MHAHTLIVHTLYMYLHFLMEHYITAIGRLEGCGYRGDAVYFICTHRCAAISGSSEESKMAPEDYHKDSV